MIHRLINRFRFEIIKTDFEFQPVACLLLFRNESMRAINQLHMLIYIQAVLQLF